MRRRQIATRWLATSVALVLIGVHLLPPGRAQAPQFSSGVNLVEVYATVTDAAGNPVTTLSRDDFEVFEDDEPQTITAFTAGEFPLSLAVALDRSFSMAQGGRLAAAGRAVERLVGALKPDDRVMLLAIGSEVEEAAPLSADRRALVAALNALEPWGTTALHDAVIAGIDRIQPERGRRALVIISDGTDRYSRASRTEALDRARAADVLVYPIALGPARPDLFAELAVVTGGRSVHVRDVTALAGTLTTIARELRSQYLLGYTPRRPIVSGEDGWRSIRVTVSRPGLRVRARDGYAAK